MEQIIQNKIIAELVEKDFDVMLTKNGIIVDGFYKSGHVLLKPQEDGHFIAHSRYEETDRIDTFDDLVLLNFRWWDYSKERSDGWASPEPKWGEEMLRLKLVTKKATEVHQWDSV